MLAEVLLLLLGLLEVRLQLVDLALLIPVLCQVYSHPVLQTLLMLVHPGVEDLFLDLPKMVGVVAVDALVTLQALDSVPYLRNLLI